MPSVLDMIAVPNSFARRRRVDLVQLALTLRQNAQRRTTLRAAPFARAFESEDSEQCNALVVVC